MTPTLFAAMECAPESLTRRCASLDPRWTQPITPYLLCELRKFGIQNVHFDRHVRIDPQRLKRPDVCSITAGAATHHGAMGMVVAEVCSHSGHMLTFRTFVPGITDDTPIAIPLSTKGGKVVLTAHIIPNPREVDHLVSVSAPTPAPTPAVPPIPPVCLPAHGSGLDRSR